MTIFRYGVALGILASFLYGCAQEPSFRGTALDPPRETRDFTLRDQLGKPVRLSDFRGRVVILTFLYTACRDVCPLVTAKLRKAREMLGEVAPRAVFLAVTTDPTRDTVKRVRAYSEKYQMLDRWHFLTGERPILQPIWKYYWVGKVWTDKEGNVMHQAPVHLIDRAGKIRVAYGSGFEPADLAEDIRILLRG
ncbi:MAG: SCO family protein [Candidatus Methylomirabilales bacterium]